MSRRPVTYSTQDVLDYLEGNFAIPEDGFETSRDLKVKVKVRKLGQL